MLVLGRLGRVIAARVNPTGSVRRGALLVVRGRTRMLGGVLRVTLRMMLSLAVQKVLRPLQSIHHFLRYNNRKKQVTSKIIQLRPLNAVVFMEGP